MPLLLFVAVLPACGSEPDATSTIPAAHRPLAADLSELRAADGLLYPPELWSALSVSARSEVLRNTALQAIGEQVAWSLPPAKLYDGLVTETDELTATFLMVEAGLDHTVAASLVRSWVAQAEKSVADPESLDRLWKSVMVAQHANVAITLSSTALSQLSTMIANPSPLIQRQALDILTATGSAPSSVPATEAWVRQVKSPTGVSDPQLLARELHSWVTVHKGSKALKLDRTFWQPMLEWVTTNDDTYAYSVRAFVAAGNLPFARELTARFDRRRLVAGGVLEPAIFSGSLGSTFRMVRFLDEGPVGVDLLADPSGLVATVQPLRSKDLSHRLAGAATTYLLRPEAVTLADRRALIASATTELDLATGAPMSAEAAMAWISLAEHASTMNVPLDFPGLSTAGQATLLGPGEEAHYAVARLLLALHATGQHDTPVAALLTDHLTTALTGRDISEVNSLLLFAGSLALRRVSGAAPFTESQLTSESDRRRGQCLGGLRTFIRERRAPSSVCNVEATRYVNALAGAVR